MNIYTALEQLIQYGLQKKLIEQWDVDFVRNQLLEALGLEDWELPQTEEGKISQAASPVDSLANILDWAADHDKLEHNTVTFRDLLDTKLMGILIARPSTIIQKFYSIYEEEGPQAATEYFYQLAKDSHYIRTDRIAKNEHWVSATPYGDLEITVNLSKPEKDPIAISAEKTKKAVTYPQCLLCKENMGYSGRVDHPARQNHRIIPVELEGDQWYLQFSPYVYYNEHAIIFSGEHVPMKISKEGFQRLLAFVEQFPHYFIGSNADLPIVGGSILSHDHFQGGHHLFPMAKAEIEDTFSFAGYEGVEAGIVRWPMSVIRLRGKDRHQIAELADYILGRWKEYSDPNVEVIASTDGVPHNTITPIARQSGEHYEFDLVLRNNRTSEQHPLGIFHPHDEVHHIKKENIGLIEVMGLAVLPGRLKEELQLVGEYLLQPDYEKRLTENELTRKHANWACQIKADQTDLTQDNVQRILQEEVGHAFRTVLEHAGVFKRTAEGKAAFRTFLHTISTS
ncbi:UDP-glucose--hexose-1-phosphate uridylyltransferase [Lederbergia sp. NSJ-179]|uniref:UDP-glucose--hexose-1-phosphate uridylyltransferase n=1 Tax=Lederbergia sp. NSJ-179 TaxID=2931402 RepID=UPI001FD18D7B|nr:UDP-glucose--hexose-1-phosphate uridylyltransferase [Lederbergia sp. NSJ-179]MCJ7842238.1 UDP-glucose--hexose-1-phosphate uridylyltransferase [Lederbergia sp. NSJ-179]